MKPQHWASLALFGIGAALLLALAVGRAWGDPAQVTRSYLPLTGQQNVTATATATASATATATASATVTASATASATATTVPSGSTSTPTVTPTPGAPRANYNLLVGPGYTDVSPKALVRTSGNRLYIGVSTCEQYPCTDVGQTLRMYRAANTGVPTGFTFVDQTKAPTGVSQWALAIDGSDTLHVVWNDRPANGATLLNLRYATFATTTDTWSSTVEILETPLGPALDSGGQGMQSVALALDARGTPYVLYLKGNGPNRRVFLRSREVGGWSAATPIDAGVSYGNNQQAWHPNLAFDTAGRLLVVWLRGSFNGDNDGTLFSRVRATDGTWGDPLNVSGTNAARVTIDQSTSLLVTPDNRYHLTWITAQTDYIRYQYSDDNGQTWGSNNPGAGLQATHNPSLGYAAGKLRIYAHGAPVPTPDGHGENLYCFEGLGGPVAWGSWTQFVTGTNYDSSVNVRWAQFFFAFPNTIDLAYWNDAYPNILYAGTDVR